LVALFFREQPVFKGERIMTKFKGKVAEPNRVTEYIHDPLSEKLIAEIKDGIFETDDKILIKRLKELGYEVIEGDVEEEIQQTSLEMKPKNRKKL
jgi:hypothetical protein